MPEPSRKDSSNVTNNDSVEYLHSSQASPSTTSHQPYQKEKPTALQLGIAALLLGSAAGFMFYTRKADSILRRMEQVTENQVRRKGPPKYGPPTKDEWDKIRPRIDKDEFF